ncbi:MAG: menaquinone biosynthesis protein [Deltaproteobacteria bacterium]|nr:menaquinone biosynthesis protein [Deltaproteobacteria bacterium]MBW1963672.1 menaquinone biosynthesis protein [Deltaproteobacteria bacterium]
MESETSHVQYARLGIVNYINTSQIYVPWQEIGPLNGWEVEEGAPTLLNRHLAQGKLDAGCVSSYAYGLNADRYYILPDLSISATGPVWSVILLSKVPIEELNEKLVLLTSQSATSVNLLHIILEDFLGIRPIFRTGNFKELSANPVAQAYLAIGDEALRLRSNRDNLFRSDLAKIWLDHTGLPFVFAVWAIREESWIAWPEKIRLLHKRLSECYHKGLKELERISNLVAPRIPMASSDCLEYLKDIELDFSGKKQQGLLHFFRLLYDRGDFPKVSELKMLPSDDSN